MTLVTPHTAIARPVPTGVARDDGWALYLRSSAGIEAVDPDTGATGLSIAAAALPVIALPDALIALRAQVRGDRWWTGRAEVVAIDVANPVPRSCGAFELPAPDGELGEVWCEGGVLHARWTAIAPATGIAPRMRPVEGELRVDLARGVVELEPGAPIAVPPTVAQAVSGLTSWSPPGLRGPWRVTAGWSAVVVTTGDAGRVATLRHWSDAGEHSAVIAEGDELRRASPLAADARDLFVRVCDDGAPACKIRIHAVDTGAVVATLADPTPPAARLEPPMARLDRILLATTTAGGVRSLVAIDLDTAAERWRRPIAAPAPTTRRPAGPGPHGR
jgi:hypothetical protein